MSYNLKNKAIVMIALSLAALMTISNISHAEEADTSSDAQNISDTMFDMGFDGNTEGQENAIEEAPVDAAENTEAASTFDMAPEEEHVMEQNDVAANDDFLNQEMSGDTPATADQLISENSDGLVPDASGYNQDNSNTSADDSSGGLFDAPLEEPQDSSSSIPDTDAPKSPFENFGNAILSKVDNDLFTQMSSIEKQNTLLNLEFKREELKNKVEALRNARIRAQEEDENRRREEQEKLKDAEAERQAQILREQTKLKEKEIELEKVRQAKVLNEYMNEMLKMNQEWVLKNTELQNQIQELKNDRVTLIKTFEDNISQIQHDTIALQKKAEIALGNHNRTIASLNSQITSLKKSVSDSEERIKKMQEGNNTNNPFAAAAAAMTMTADMDEGAIDMSEEYAIMDITGQGEDIVAKIVNKEGTTFIVHKGSMLKGGEIVTSITDHYVGFDNNGVKSFIYTGGTVLEFEPTVAFNDADKLPLETEKSSIKNDHKNVLGNPSTNDIAPKMNAGGGVPPSNVGTGNRSSSRRRAGASTSFGSGMFVQ